MIKQYNITVNGNTYSVEVEELGGVATPAAPAAAAPAAPAPQAAPPAAPAPASGGSKQLVAPMPGTVLKINVKEGDAVNQGDTLVVIEAMKMENELMADSSGTVDKISVSEGDSVNSGDVLVTLR